MKIVALFLLLCSTASAQLVLNDNLRQTTDQDPDLDFGFWLGKVAETGAGAPCHALGCNTYAGFRFNNGIVSGETISLDEGSDWFAASPGQAFGADTVGDFPLLIGAVTYPDGIHHGSAHVGSDFYLAFRTGWGFVGPTHLETSYPRRNAYGWVHLQETDGSFSVLGSAIAYNATGIVVGIPEPSTICLLWAQWAAWLWPKRRQRP